MRGTTSLTVVENPRVITLNPEIRNKTKHGIGISTSSGIEILKMADIVHCEAEGNYCHIYCRNGRSIMASKTLKTIEAALQEYAFIRVHQSHVVSLTDIRKVNKEGLFLNCGKSIPISRAKRASLIIYLERMITII